MANTVTDMVGTWTETDRTAVVDGTTVLTYAQLNRRADAVAVALVSRLGDARGVVVGVLLPRSADYVVAVLGVLKAGAAYLPLDPDYPASRLELMRDAAASPITITSPALAARVPGPSLLVDSGAADDVGGREPFDAVPVSGDDLAYVMFTSGSTGVPKGVEVTHRAVAGLVSHPDSVRPSTADVVLAVSSVSFDGSTFDIWSTLANGACLVIAPMGASAVDIGELLCSASVTTVLFPTGLFHVMVDECLSSLTRLRTVLVGGDVLSRTHSVRFLTAAPTCTLLNIYGPTETTVYVAVHRVPVDVAEPVPIGFPAAGAQLRVLDTNRCPAAEGQLHVGGDGLARGYLGDPALTSTRFPVVDGERLYATGDRVRVRPDGALEFRGRLDDQVKKRGFRVEPGEVEAALRSDPRVRDAAVVMDGGAADTRRLVACVVLVPGADLAAVRDGVDLPAYMHPDVWRTLPALPLTPNGKVDREALATPVAAHSGTASAPDDPGRDDTMRRVVSAIWCEVLDLTEVAPTDNFFDLGGHSLLANRVIAQIRRRLGITVSIAALFDHPTVAELTAAVREEVLAPAR